MNYAYVEGKPSQTLLLENPGAFPSTTTSTRCERVLAIVTAAAHGTVTLRFIETK